MKRELQKKEEAIQKANIGGMWKVKIIVKLPPNFFRSMHSPEPEILSSIENVNFVFFSNTKDLIVPSESSAKQVNQMITT